MKYTVKLKKAQIVRITVGEPIGEAFLSPNGNMIKDLLDPYNKHAIDNFFALYEVPDEISDILRKILEKDYYMAKSMLEILSESPTKEVVVEILDIES